MTDPIQARAKYLDKYAQEIVPTGIY